MAWFSTLLEHTKHFIDIYTTCIIHPLQELVFYDFSSQHSHSDEHMWQELGVSISPKDALAWRLEQPGMLYLRSYSNPIVQLLTQVSTQLQHFLVSLQTLNIPHLLLCIQHFHEFVTDCRSEAWVEVPACLYRTRPYTTNTAFTAGLFGLDGWTVAYVLGVCVCLCVCVRKHKSTNHKQANIMTPHNPPKLQLLH